VTIGGRRRSFESLAMVVFGDSMSTLGGSDGPS